ncbi:MAG TPA: hypothetical protein VK698_05850 [Kofleriaceae bacterium]|nr:hypothetical protein [Kofleriaceae bacterium]
MLLHLSFTARDPERVAAVVAVWLEGTQLIELTTPELLPDYVALYGPAGREGLDRSLRAVEAHIRAAGPGH